MKYVEHIRKMNDAQLAYFLTLLHIDVPNLMLAMERTEADNRSNGKNYDGPDVYSGLSGDARMMMHYLYCDYDQEMRDLDESYNENLHLPWEKR